MHVFYKWISPAFILLAMPLASPSSENNTKPNVVLILADDMGYTDLGAYAERATGTPIDQQFYETPNLDKLVDEGIAFSQAYVCPLCSPTRSSLITGRYAAKIGFMTATGGRAESWYNQGRTPPSGYMAQDVISWKDDIKEERALENGSTLLALPAGTPYDQGRDETTLAEALNEHGYRSTFIGKWHLGGHGSKGYEPHDQGFEEIAYYDAGGSHYFNWQKAWDRRNRIHDTMPQEELLIGKSGDPTDEDYLTDDLTVQATRFIENHSETQSEKPFFLYFCHFALHGPLQAKQEDIAHFDAKPTKGWNSHTNATYAAMTRSLDDSVGALVKTLEKVGQLENTLIVFMSDNGGVSWPLNQKTRDDATRPTHNAPLKGGKAMVFEGGIRVPLVFFWKGRLTSNQWVDRAVDCNDIFPTILELAGINPSSYYEQKNQPAIDGRSLVSLLRDESEAIASYDRDTFYWHYPYNVIVYNPVDDLPLTPHSAIRQGPYKLIYDWSGRIWLYNVEEDISETRNLAEEQPELAQSLFQRLNDWLDQNVSERYLPTLNPTYNPAKDKRDHPFVDLRKEILGADQAIKPAPKLSALDELK